jgi:hypothetical protein
MTGKTVEQIIEGVLSRNLVAMTWQPISTAPQDGTRVRLAHELDPQSQKVDSPFITYGSFKDDRWQCNNAFVCIDHMLRWQPTHWMPMTNLSQGDTP